MHATSTRHFVKMVLFNDANIKGNRAVLSINDNIQLSYFFAYPNIEIPGVGQRVRIIEVGLFQSLHGV